MKKQQQNYKTLLPFTGRPGGVLVWVWLLLLLSTPCYAINIDSLLIDIEQNNVQMKTVNKQNEAQAAEARQALSIGETAVEYSPFYQRGVSGLASSELIVSQEFDFPTLYSARRKQISLQQNIMNTEYQIVRRDVMIEAGLLCCNLIAAQENACLIQKRLAVADSLLAVCEKRMRYGTATIMEQNRIRLDRMTIETEMVENQGEQQRIRLELVRLGLTADCNTVEGDVASCLQRRLGMGQPLELQLADANIEAAKQNVRLQNQSWLPKMTIGYRRNTEVRESQNGFLVGISMPLFSNSQKIKTARLKQSATEQELTAKRQEIDNRRHQLEAEADNAAALMAAYNQSLMDQTLATLLRAVTSGEVSVTDYYTEADRIYQLQQKYIEAKAKYQKASIELIRNK